MIRRSLTILAVSTSLVGCATNRELAASSEPASAEVARANSQETTLVRVIDGDTIVVSINGKEERVRLVGIDTPEKGACGFEEAAEALQLLISTSKVELIDAGVSDRDQFDRLLRYVEVDGGAPGLELIRAGLAEAAYDSRTGYPAHNREDEYVLADALSLDWCGNG